MNMNNTESDEAGHGREGALAALLEVTADPAMTNNFSIPTSAFRAEDYEQLIALAWRHQFDEDRTKFKREIRELQTHVSQRILDVLELLEQAE